MRRGEIDSCKHTWYLYTVDVVIHQTDNCDGILRLRVSCDQIEDTMEYEYLWKFVGRGYTFYVEGSRDFPANQYMWQFVEPEDDEKYASFSGKHTYCDCDLWCKCGRHCESEEACKHKKNADLDLKALVPSIPDPLIVSMQVGYLDGCQRVWENTLNAGRRRAVLQEAILVNGQLRLSIMTLYGQKYLWKFHDDEVYKYYIEGCAERPRYKNIWLFEDVRREKYVSIRDIEKRMKCKRKCKCKYFHCRYPYECSYYHSYKDKFIHIEMECGDFRTIKRLTNEAIVIDGRLRLREFESERHPYLYRVNSWQQYLWRFVGRDYVYYVQGYADGPTYEHIWRCVYPQDEEYLSTILDEDPEYHDDNVDQDEKYLSTILHQDPEYHDDNDQDEDDEEDEEEEDYDYNYEKIVFEEKDPTTCDICYTSKSRWVRCENEHKTCWTCYESLVRKSCPFCRVRY